jgi:hypothetical protein
VHAEVVAIVLSQNDPVQEGLPEVDRTSGTAEETEYDLVAPRESTRPMRPPPLAETVEFEKVFEIAHSALPARPPDSVPPRIVPKLKLRVIVAKEPPSQRPAKPPTD